MSGSDPAACCYRLKWLANQKVVHVWQNNEPYQTHAADFNGEQVEDHKFLLTQYRVSYVILAKHSIPCFWPVTFKRRLKFWSVFLEKFAMPHAIGKLEKCLSSGAQPATCGIVHMVRCLCCVPRNSSVELLTHNVTGSSDAYEVRPVSRGEISTVILGHSAA